MGLSNRGGRVRSCQIVTCGAPHGCVNSVEPARMSPGMQRLRLLLTLAVVLTLPGYGLAGLAYGRSCQEQMKVASHTVLPGDCCPGKADHESPCKGPGSGFPGKNGPCSACKAGFNCKSPPSYEPTSVVVLVLEPYGSTLTAAPSTPPLSHSPEGLWRPPRLV